MALSLWEGSLPGEVGVERAASYVAFILVMSSLFLHGSFGDLWQSQRAFFLCTWALGFHPTHGHPGEVGGGVDHVNAVGSRVMSSHREKGS